VPARRFLPEPEEPQGWDERIGTFGVAVVGVVACVVGWLVMWKFF
jgi:hypothetical protein